MNATDTDLVLYADEKLDPARELQLLEQAAHDAELAKTLAMLRASRLPFKLAVDCHAQPFMPSGLQSDLRDYLFNKPTPPQQTTPVNDSAQQSPDHHTAPLIDQLSIGIALGYATGASANDSHSSLRDSDADGHAALAQSIQRYQSLALATLLRNAPPMYNYSGTGNDNPAVLTDATSQVVVTHRGTAEQQAPDLTGYGYQLSNTLDISAFSVPLTQLLYIKDGHQPLALCHSHLAPGPNQDYAIHHRNALAVTQWSDTHGHFVLVCSEEDSECDQIRQQIEHFIHHRTNT
ncbi:MAG: hypothetical protein AAF404_17755 [Pseudomonadota bacterium]